MFETSKNTTPTIKTCQSNLTIKGLESTNLFDGVFFVQSSTRVIFYVRRTGLYLYKYRNYATISIYILKGLDSVYQLK